ncbi:MAG: sll0787 family AIR synthase-like protein [Candidatus Phaeomarinobacter sp.]
MDVTQIASSLSAPHSNVSKLSIAKASGLLGLSSDRVGRPGDDAAVLTRDDGGFDLLAGEGFIPAFVQDDPWFAGWCGVMVNLSDIAAMGGRATALVDQIWAPDLADAQPVLEGMKSAAAAYGVPVVGGHSNLSAGELNLAVSVFGRAKALITSFDAQPGDVLIAAVDKRGAYRNFDNYFAAGSAPAGRLRTDLELLPQLAEAGLVTSGKDISQGGIVGTALMLAECSGVAIDIDLEKVDPPQNTSLERWLRSFPSFGFLLAVKPDDVETVCALFEARALEAQPIGQVKEGSCVRLMADGESSNFWDHQSTPYLGFGKGAARYA